MADDEQFDHADLTDAIVYDDPWAFYAWLRDEHPVWFDRNSGLHAISRHADVQEVSRNARVFSAAQGVRPVSPVPLSILSMDDPEHFRQRRVVSRGFTPRQVQQMTEHVRGLTNSVIDQVESSGEIDFVVDLARHVPLMVISELLGLEPELRDTLFEWSEALIGGEGADPTSPELARAAQAFGDYAVLISTIIEQRRLDPQDDLISILTNAFDEGILAYDAELKALYEESEAAELSNDELLMFCVLLMVAGNETTRNAIAGGLRAFSQFPAERDRLIAQPELIDRAVEEILRWTTPVFNFMRTVTEPTSMHGTELAIGDRVLLLYQSANRDPRAFDDADSFRIDRDPNPHLAFGFGPHFCLGSSLARMEIKVVFQELFRRLPDIEVIDPDSLPARAPSAFVAGLQRLPARFTPVR